MPPLPVTLHIRLLHTQQVEATFAAEAHRQSCLVAEADNGSDDQDFVESIATSWDDEE
ncbi:antitoxin MazE-like protein [Gordonia rhizosphera]|uniref:antitoxin MazE-like protein n=1 Tax=Gordonia rhizosphera TaxID=83341 RepID=UPI00277D0975|nr:antitoxin MazE-like protein [Gordonia rhizosphera]